jgi:hypothetical protein
MFLKLDLEVQTLSNSLFYKLKKKILELLSLNF